MKKTYINFALLNLLVLATVWNISNTIVFRQLALLFLLIITIWVVFPGKDILKNNWFLIAFFLYLPFHLLFLSSDAHREISIFFGPELRLFVCSVIGLGLGGLFKDQIMKYLFLYLGTCFSIPLYIHLFLFIKTWILEGYFPYGYWGINLIHGDLGLAALAASLFLTIYFFYYATHLHEKSLACLMLLPCILSPLFAASRGGTVFVIFMILIVFILTNLNLNKAFLLKKSKIFIPILFISCAFIFWIAKTYQPERWMGTFSRIEFGMKIDNPEKIICEGTPLLIDQLKQKNIEITPKIQALIDGVEDGDGARVIVARAAIELIKKNPLGMDGSKESYQKAIKLECEQPKNGINHAHNGWLNMALSIGIPGAILYFLTILTYLKFGLSYIKAGIELQPFAVALVAMTFFWIIRACFDSTERDQAIEMQFFLITFLYSLLWNQLNRLE